MKGELLTRWSVPFIVKPAREDNSFGVSLVKTEDDVVRCLENAFKYDQRVLVEQYIAGREVRVVALEWENEEGMSLEVLPKIEEQLYGTLLTDRNWQRFCTSSQFPEATKAHTLRHLPRRRTPPGTSSTGQGGRTRT